jgi:hypothetical protein
VFTKVVRPGHFVSPNDHKPQSSYGDIDVPVPEAPQTIKQNWIPFFTFFFFRSIFYTAKRVSNMRMNAIVHCGTDVRYGFGRELVHEAHRLHADMWIIGRRTEEDIILTVGDCGR